VLLQDSGEGNNTSLPQTFTITINKPVPGQNSRNRLDTNDDGFVSPIDAVLVINFTNVTGTGPIARPPLPGIVLDPGFYPDVDGDNFLSPIDAVLVINSLNATAAAAAANGPGSFGGESNGAATGEGESAVNESASGILTAMAYGELAGPIAGADSADLGDTVLFELLALDIARSRRRRFTLLGG
jgi:hypothetical protein